MVARVLELSMLNQAIPSSLLSLSFFVLFSLDRRFPHFPDAGQGRQGGFISYQLSCLFNGISTPFTISFWIIQSATKLLSALMLMHLINNITFNCKSGQNVLCAFESTLSGLLFFCHYWFPAFQWIFHTPHRKIPIWIDLKIYVEDYWSWQGCRVRIKRNSFTLK